MLIDPSGNPSIPFTLFAMECEGEIDTPVGKRNKVIKNLRQRACWQLLDEDIVREEAAAAGLGILTDQEIADIIREVSGY